MVNSYWRRSKSAKNPIDDDIYIYIYTHINSVNQMNLEIFKKKKKKKHVMYREGDSIVNLNGRYAF